MKVQFSKLSVLKLLVGAALIGLGTTACSGSGSSGGGSGSGGGSNPNAGEVPTVSGTAQCSAAAQDFIAFINLRDSGQLNKQQVLAQCEAFKQKYINEVCVSTYSDGTSYTDAIKDIDCSTF